MWPLTIKKNYTCRSYTRKWLKYLKGKQDNNRGPVEHVMYCRCREGSFKLFPASNLGHGYQRVGHGGANIGTHKHRHGYSQFETSASNGGHNDWGESWGTLHQHSAKNSNHQTNHGIVLQPWRIEYLTCKWNKKQIKIEKKSKMWP